MKDYGFRDAEFMTAKEKGLVLKAWNTFLKHGLKRKHFIDRLYKHLTLHCSFIAHFDANGFHRTYFGASRLAAIRFLEMFDPNGDGISAEYGSRSWLENMNYSDINQAMREVAGPYIGGLIKAKNAEERAADLAEAVRLLKKYNINTDGLKLD